MSVNGEKCSDKARISNHSNSFFATIGSQNENNIRKQEGSTYKNYLTNQYDCTFAFHLISNNDTLRITKNIKMSHSKGYDCLSTEHLKLINKDISKCLTLIINQSLNSGIFPDKLKIAKVTPILKNGDKQIITNYRPISVLPVISKIFETVIHEQLSEYFVTNNLFSPQQYGFRKNSSTELAALELLDRLLIQLDSRKIPINFYRSVKGF